MEEHTFKYPKAPDEHCIRHGKCHLSWPAVDFIGQRPVFHHNTTLADWLVFQNMLTEALGSSAIWQAIWQTAITIHTFLCFGIFPSASNFALACLLLIIRWYCFAFTYNGSSNVSIATGSLWAKTCCPFICDKKQISCDNKQYCE